jgi:hypothetical protein
MNYKPTEAQVWNKFRKTVESQGYLFLKVKKEFKKQVYDLFMSEYNSDPLTVEEFANLFMSEWCTIPHRSIDNIGDGYMKPTS